MARRTVHRGVHLAQRRRYGDAGNLACTSRPSQCRCTEQPFGRLGRFSRALPGQSTARVRVLQELGAGINTGTAFALVEAYMPHRPLQRP